MSTSDNLFGDLLRIGAGDASAVSERIQEFHDYAKTVTESAPPSTDDDCGEARHADLERHAHAS